MKRLKLLGFAVFLSALIGLNSCSLPEFGAPDSNTWNPDFVVPVVNTSLQLQDLLDNFETGGFVATDPDNVIVVVYQDEVKYSFGGSIEEIPDLPIPIFDSTQTINLSISPLRYDEIRIEEADVEFDVNNNESEDMNVTFTIQDLTQNGTSFQTTFTIPANGTQNVSVPIMDYLMTFPSVGLTTSYTAVGANTGMHYKLPTFISFIKNIDYTLVQGYMGVDTIQMATGDIVIDFLQNWTQGSVVFEEPRLTFTFDNSYGTPIRIFADSVNFKTNLLGLQPINSPDLTNGFDVAFPSTSEIGQSKFSSFDIDENNSNIVNVIAGVPYELGYTINGVFNPNMDSTLTNFLTDSSHVDIGVDVELPMHLSAKDFGTKYVIDADLGDIEVIERVGFKFIADNGFPFEVGMQVRFLDAANQAIDSLFADGSNLLIEAAEVDGNGFVTTPVSKETVVEILADRFQAIKDGTVKIEIEATFETLNQGNVPVKILSDYEIGMKLGVTAGL